MAIQKFAFTQKTDTKTLLNFIAQKLTVSKNKAKQFLDRRLVFVNKKRVWIASYKLNKGDMVEVVTDKTQLSDSSSKHTGTRFQKDTILFKDNHYLIVSKPPDIVTNGPDSLEEQLRTTDARSMQNLSLEFDAGAELDHAIGGDPEECRGACGIARHQGKKLLAPQRHARPDFRDQRLPAPQERRLPHLQLP